MGTRPDAGIVPVSPVREIVPGLGARPRVVRDLVGRQPGDFHGGLGRLEQGRGESRIRRDQFAAALGGVKGRPRLDGQLVERKVVRFLVQCLRQLLPPSRDGLLRSCVD